VSDPRTKAERSLAKDIRQGVVEQRPVGSKGKSRGAAKPYAIKGSFFRWKEHVVGRYASLDDALKALSAYRRKALYHGIKLFGPDGEISPPEDAPADGV